MQAQLTTSRRLPQNLRISVHDGATNHLLVDGPQQMKNPLKSVPVPLQLPQQAEQNPVAAVLLQESSPQASLVRASYCSLAFHLPEGIVRSHIVQEQQQQQWQNGQEAALHLQPKLRVSVHAPHTCETQTQQVVVVNPRVAVRVGPITLAFPGYALLLRFAGRNGGMSYTSSVGLVIHS